MRQLGEIMERIDHGEGCELIEPVVPEPSAKPFIEQKGVMATTAYDLRIHSAAIFATDAIIITTKAGSHVPNDVTLVYPETEHDGNHAAITLSSVNWNDILTSIPLTVNMVNNMHNKRSSG